LLVVNNLYLTYYTHDPHVLFTKIVPGAHYTHPEGLLAAGLGAFWGALQTVLRQRSQKEKDDKRSAGGRGRTRKRRRDHGPGRESEIEKKKERER
jgi:hypothetical protein